MIISETAACYHFAWINATGKATPVPDPVDTYTRLQIKQAWWQQFLNATFLAQYPQIKAVSTFEFIKSEEATWRDFTMFGPAPDPDPTSPDFKADDTAVVNAFSAQAGNMSFLLWGNITGNATVTGTSTATASTKSAAVGVAVLSGLITAGAYFLAI